MTPCIKFKRIFLIAYTGSGLDDPSVLKWIPEPTIWRIQSQRECCQPNPNQCNSVRATKSQDDRFQFNISNNPHNVDTANISIRSLNGHGNRLRYETRNGLWFVCTQEHSFVLEDLFIRSNSFHAIYSCINQHSITCSSESNCDCVIAENPEFRLFLIQSRNEKLRNKTNQRVSVIIVTSQSEAY